MVRQCSPGNERGAALVMAMIFLLIMTLLGLSAMKTSSLDTRIVANLKEELTAFQMAETGLELSIHNIDTATGFSDFETAIASYAVGGSGVVTTSIASGDLGMGSSSTINLRIAALGTDCGLAKGYSTGKFILSCMSISATANRLGSKAQAQHSRGVGILTPGS